MASKSPLWMINAVNRLREIARSRSIVGASGKVLAEGYPTPEHVMKELRNAYQKGKRAAAKEQG